ncbi:hypothetical protein F4553_002334 [Allocatelliglobosispora scoriae]|uniref:Protein phosphatase 2C domain-containing protein n=1 Tax=Allocatelliglobosispora scoriae TaxID=643052 RepID=A0A841BMR2_9ACTN|nr:hypothetical protein [Allocatelliglobosispora scoriae]MBB5868955.1 hypothetical protein [Allocatelliglobosispora scoriae]
MRVVTASETAPGREANEDRVAHAMGLVCVLDGVTAVSDLDNGCIHDPAWYVERLMKNVMGCYASESRVPLARILACAISCVAAEHQDTCDLSVPSTPASTVCLLRDHPDDVEYLVLCDATLVLDSGDITAVTDTRFADLIARLRADAPELSALEMNRGHTPGKWDHINREGGYWIAAADPLAAYRGLSGSAPKHGPGALRRAALLTDGASCAVDKFGLMGWAALLDLVEVEGPRELIAQVRRAERTAVTSAGTKPHDDATVALCLFEQGDQL